MNKSIALVLVLAASTGCVDQDEPAESDTSQAIATNNVERMFAIAGGVAMSRYQTGVNATTYSPWESLGGTDLRKLITERNDDGRLSLFAIGGDGKLYGRYQIAVGGGWNPDGWGLLGGTAIQQVVTARFAGRIELFARFGDGGVYRRFQTAPNGGWNPEGWIPFGGYFPLDLATTMRSDGALDIIAIGSDGHAYQKVQMTLTSFDPTWTPIGGTNLRHVALARDPANHEFIFALDAAGTIQVAERTTGWWSNFTPINSMTGITQIAVASEADSRLDLFALGGDARLYELPEVAPGGPWSPSFHALGAHEQILGFALTNQGDGRITAVSYAPLGWVLKAEQTGLLWSNWLTFGGLDSQSDLIATQQPL